MGSEAQDQVEDLLGKFTGLKEDFDRGVGVQTFKTVGVVNDKVDALFVDGRCFFLRLQLDSYFGAIL